MLSFVFLVVFFSVGGRMGNQPRRLGKDGILQGEVRLWNAIIGRNAKRID